MSTLLSTLQKRRSHYGLDKNSKLSNEEVLARVKETVQTVPSAFNAQTQRVVVLFDDASETFWDLTRDALKAVAPAEGFENTVAKLKAFAAGQGTILFYVDTAVVEGLQKQFALYADNFPIWAQQENGMLQYTVWSVLAEAGLGANLQHYNPVVDASAAKEFNVPASWKLVAQMPFGNPVGDVSEKPLPSVDDKVLSF